MQIDFELRASERPILLSLLRRLRAGLPRNVALSMTALAAWCETEHWLDAAPVDEVVPMLFRMGREGGAIRARLANGGDFAALYCRKALAVAVDAPIDRAPTVRRVYLFDSRSWTETDFESLARRVQGWDRKRN